MESKYNLLTKTLDKIIVKNNPTKQKITDNDRATAYIHLLLLVRFGIHSTDERNKLITDGTDDGGIDAYFIEEQKHIVYIIQSKFRTTEKNYEEKEISPAEIACMEIDRIISGEKKTSYGKDYNNKIKIFQSALSKLDCSKPITFKVILLANLEQSDNLKVFKAILGDYEYETYNYQRAYNDLVLPYFTGTFPHNETLIIDSTVTGVSNSYTEYFESTSLGRCSASLLFVPLTFIAEIVSKYKNALLEYNPRSFLDFKDNPVNKSIMAGALQDNQDFALLNNGITIVCSKFICNDKNGKPNSSHIHIENPQIINGGQTAYTLSQICKSPNDKFINKRVLLKVISTCKNEKKDDEFDESDYLSFILSISEATNKQTKIDDADRKANMQVQINLQKRIFDDFGLLYERKNGEYYEATNTKIVSKQQIIKRDQLIRCILAFSGKSNEALGTSKNKLFSDDIFNSVINSSTDHLLAVYAYLLFTRLEKQKLENMKNKHFEWGNGVLYGKYALISAIGMHTNGKILKEKIINSVPKSNSSGKTQHINLLPLLEEEATKNVDSYLAVWRDFEEYAKKQPNNHAYFSVDNTNYNSYYKSKNSTVDINKYWKNKTV